MAITLGLVEAIDSNGVYVSMPGSRGVLRGPYRSVNDVAVGSSVLVEQTDDGEQVVVGTVGKPPRVGTYNVLDYGASGDGSTDDTAAIQAAVNAAYTAGGGAVLFPPGRTYAVDRIGLRSNVSFYGYGATLKMTTTGHCALDGRVYDEQHDDITIEGFDIDVNGVQSAGGIILYRSSGVTVRDCTVYGMSGGGAGGFGIYVQWLTEDCHIMDNTVIGPVDDPFGTVASCIGIGLMAEAPTDVYAGGNNNTLTFETPLTTNWSRRHVVRGNTVSGGTHPILLFAATDCVIADNNVTGGTHRGIHMSPIACRNVISGNRVRDYGSTGIMMGWGCTDNLIVGNVVTTTTSMIEGDGIKAYYGCSGNSVVGNRVSGSANAGVRMAMASGGFLIADNHITDCVVGVSVESYIKATNPLYPQPTDPPDVTGWTVAGNHIADCTTGIQLHQGNLTFGEDADQYLKDGVLFHNHVIGATTGVLFTENYTGKITDITAAGNLLRASGTDWDTPRGSAHFAADETPHP